MRYVLCAVHMSRACYRIFTAYLCAFLVSFHSVNALGCLCVCDGQLKRMRLWLLLALQQSVNKYFKFSTS